MTRWGGPAPFSRRLRLPLPTPPRVCLGKLLVLMAVATAPFGPPSPWSTPTSPRAALRVPRSAAAAQHPTTTARMGSWSLVNGVADTLYNRGEGVRYAVEQTFGYTIPRFTQQLFRTYDITGETNRQAAEEIFIRDNAADFTDTFLPGLLATLGVGALLDRHRKTLVGANMDHQSLNFYQKLLHGTQTRDQFYQQLENAALGTRHGSPQSEALPTLKASAQHLKDWTANHKGGKQFTHLVRSMGGKAEDPFTRHAQQQAERLGLSSLDVTLNHQGHTLETTLPSLLKDLTRIEQKAVGWGPQLGEQLAKTARLQPLQASGTVVAFATSLMIPHWIRQFMVKRYGPQADTNPATRAIAEFYERQRLEKFPHVLTVNGPKMLAAPSLLRQTGETSPSAFLELGTLSGAEQNTPHETAPHPTMVTPGTRSGDALLDRPTKLRWFPYVRDAWANGNPVPALTSAAFFAFLGGVAGRHFVTVQNGRIVPKLKQGLQEFFSYERSFPFTTLRQMELTYGALCGVRLLESRNDADFRETLLRDNILGFPTLTWGCSILRQHLSRGANQMLLGWLKKDNLISADQARALGHKLMFKDARATVRREAQELTAPMLERVLKLTADQRDKLPAITERVRNMNNAVTLTSAAISISLLAFLEPQLGIWMTNAIEKRKHRDQATLPSPGVSFAKSV